MNRLVPSRPLHARIRRAVGSLPHGLPTAMTFTVSVGVLLFGSAVVVDRALPSFSRPDADLSVDGPSASAATPPATPADGSATLPPPSASSIPGATPVLVIAIGARSETRGGTTTLGAGGAAGGTTGSAGGQAGGQGATPLPRPTGTPMPTESPDGGGGSGWPHATPTPHPTPTPRPTPTPDGTERPWPRPTPTPSPTRDPGAGPTPTPRPTGTPRPTPEP